MGGGMRLVPNSRAARIRFYQVRLGPWASNAAFIGLSADSVNHLIDLTEAARVAAFEHRAAQQAARAAAQRFRDAVDAMHAGPGAGADMIDAIRNHAESTDDPAVYTAALLPKPDTSSRPGSAPPPGKPTRIEAELLQTGAITLRWKCTNPKGTQGTVYLVQRQRGGKGPLETLGIASKKRFTDETIPVGGGDPYGMVLYHITAIRSAKRGITATQPVQLGVGGGADGAKGTGVVKVRAA